MKNQIIKSKIDFLNDFIVSIGTKEHNYIMINENHYKKIHPFYTNKTNNQFKCSENFC